MSQTWENKLGLLPPPEPEHVEEPVQDFGLETSQVIELARTSLDFLSALILPSVFRYFFPDIYKTAWQWLLSYAHKDREFPQLALGLPRGFAKTTFIKIFLFYIIVFTKRQFILVCAHDQAKSEAILADVCDFLDEPNVQKVFGNWRVGLETDQARLKKFGFRGRDIIMVAATVKTVRGLNLKHRRPDVMLFDDIQSREDAESEQVSTQLETDLYGTAMKAKSPHGCMFLFTGNMYPTKHSILRKIKTNPTWFKFIIGGVLADGTSLWEELQPIKQLLVEYYNDAASGKPEVFYAEVLNDETASVNTLINLNAIPEYPFNDDDVPLGKFVIIDPASGKENKDAVTVMYCEVQEHKNKIVPVAREIVEGSLSPAETIWHALRMCLTRGCCVIGIESNAYQSTLAFWFDYIMQQNGISGIQAVEIYSGKSAKNSRIMTMFKELVTGEIFVHPNCRALVNNQITSFNPLKTNNVDGILDCLYYGPRMIGLYGELIKATNIIQLMEMEKIPVRSEIETSCF